MTRNKSKLARARQFRQEATIAERRVWDVVRNRGLLGLKFRRQHRIRGLIVDFFCPELDLVLEIDGSVHEDPDCAEYDESRTRFLKKLGLTVLRISNEKARREHLEDMIQHLIGKCRESC